MTLILSTARPDAVTSTSVIRPFFTREVSPLDIARSTIGPFIESVRASGMAVEQAQPHVLQVARAAQLVAQKMQAGLPVKASPPVAAAAKMLARGQAVKITSKGKTVTVSPPIVPQTPAAPLGATAGPRAVLLGPPDHAGQYYAPSIYTENPYAYASLERQMASAFAPGAVMNARAVAAQATGWAARTTAPALASIPATARQQALLAYRIANQRR